MERLTTDGAKTKILIFDDIYNKQNLSQEEIDEFYKDFENNWKKRKCDTSDIIICCDLAYSPDIIYKNGQYFTNKGEPMKYLSQEKYDKTHTIRMCGMKLNLKTDKDIIDKLTSLSNKQGYIKNLIRNDIKNS